jgi:uncharacterized Zn finger protein
MSDLNVKFLREINAKEYLVESETQTGAHYIVKIDLGENDDTCTCPDYANRKRPCKHIKAARISND